MNYASLSDITLTASYFTFSLLQHLVHLHTKMLNDTTFKINSAKINKSFADTEIVTASFITSITLKC